MKKPSPARLLVIPHDKPHSTTAMTESVNRAKTPGPFLATTAPTGVDVSARRGPPLDWSVGRDIDLDRAVVAHAPLIKRVESTDLETVGETTGCEDEIELLCRGSWCLPTVVVGGHVHAAHR